MAAGRPRGRRRLVSTRERAAYHEAGHVVGWLSAPFEPPDIYGVTIEPDRSRLLSGEVRQRARASLEPHAHQLALGRALSRGKLSTLATALAELSAHVRAHASGPVAEALRAGLRLAAVAEGECDYWNAYELIATAGLEPDLIWRVEVRRARRWLRRRWDHVEHLARLLLRQPAGRRTLAGAPLTAVIGAARRGASSPYDASRYRAAARVLLARHRARWRTCSHWVVLEVGDPRNTAVAWADDARSAGRVARDLMRRSEGANRYVVQRRRRRAS